MPHRRMAGMTRAIAPRAWSIIALFMVSISVIAASDYAREERWKNEITQAIVVGDPEYLEQKNGHKFLGIYTEASNAKLGVVVVHGIGIHPDWGMIATLRQRLPDHGYTTLSIQMPVLAADARAEDYAATFPEAIERMQLAVAFLGRKGCKRIAIVSHSLGSRMARAFMADNPAGISAWVALGMSDAAIAYRGIEAPVLDLYGSNDLPQVLAGSARRLASLTRNTASKQAIIANTDHFFAGHENEMVMAVKTFLDGLK